MPNTRKKLVRKRKKKTKSRSCSSPFTLRKSKNTRCYSPVIQRKSENEKTCVEKVVKKRSFKTKSSMDGVKRIYTPYNKFSVNPAVTTMAPKTPQTNPPTGLSTKERSYLVSRCATRASRYAALKTRAYNAMRDNKIFTICGCANAVRKALVERGWVEKIPPNKMNLARIRNKADTSKCDVHSELERILLSNMVDKNDTNFIWYSSDDYRDNSIDMAREYNVIVNKLRVDARWTTKQGLCMSMKENYWHYIEDVSEVTCPRTYTSHDEGDVEDFVADFKLTACTSLLKWVLSMSANQRPIFCDNGTISLNVIIFALNRCKEYLFQKQNKDIDKRLNPISVGQWNAFLKKYYRIISKEEVFEIDKESKLPVYLAFAKFLLKEIHRYRPQLSCEGAHNIWIIKPAHCSRGRGIRMASKLGVILNVLTKPNAKFVVQKYIEEPILIHETKFDIRQYYLVTSTHPLVIWMYRDCYLKFSSQKYSLRNFHESIHLTNNAVQKKYKNCSGRHSELPANNMWHLETYKEYLYNIGKENVWENIIYPGMRKSIVGIMLSCQDSLSFSKNRFELYGCDFILDKEYKPWLIEINSCPDLNHTTTVTGKICPEVVADIIKVVVDYSGNSKASTGKFQCIYRQTLTVPRYSGTSDLIVVGHALRQDYFYRGAIKLEKPCESECIEEELDIQTILDKLKEKYERDIMREPDNDITSNKTIKSAPEKIHDRSDGDELVEAAKLITSQLDELINRISSDTDTSRKDLFLHKIDSDILANNINLKKVTHNVSNHLVKVRSVTDVDSLFKKSVNLFSSVETLYKHQLANFNFSKLDDGPYGKGSVVGASFNINSHERKLTTSDLFSSKSDSTDNMQKAKNTILKAASDVLNFLNKKEVEYKTK